MLLLLLDPRDHFELMTICIFIIRCTDDNVPFILEVILYDATFCRSIIPLKFLVIDVYNVLEVLGFTQNLYLVRYGPADFFPPLFFSPAILGSVIIPSWRRVSYKLFDEKLGEQRYPCK